MKRLLISLGMILFAIEMSAVGVIFANPVPSPPPPKATHRMVVRFDLRDLPCAEMEVTIGTATGRITGKTTGDACSLVAVLVVPESPTYTVDPGGAWSVWKFSRADLEAMEWVVDLTLVGE